MGVPDDMNKPFPLFPRLKFAGIRSVISDTHREEKAGFPQYAVQDPAQPQERVDQSIGGQTSIKYEYDKLASDKPGKELEPDASIWRIYAKEAKEHDRDLVDRRDKNLETMLLFATLFSAILTAFLVESMALLQPSPNEPLAALLLNLAQSQWRIETGHQDKSLPMIEIPLFKPPLSARWINVLWFMALALSLGAAMIAMIAKEWLQEFISFTVEHPHEYMLKRQARLDKLLSWHTLPIIDFLPTILHLSLVFFALGLLVHLWLLDHVIGLVMVPASTILSLLYLIVVGLGIWNRECPFQTRLSTRIWRWRDEWASKGGKFPAGVSNLSRTTDELRALHWLMTKSRDPAIGDSALQALAGWPSLQVGPNPTPANIGPDDDYTVVQMGTTIVNRLENMLLKSPRELAFCRGTNAARYACALPGTYRSACRYLERLRGMGQCERGNMKDWGKRLNHVITFKNSVFKGLDKIWDDECPPFTASVYAKLTTAELRLVAAVLEGTSTPPYTALECDTPQNITIGKRCVNWASLRGFTSQFSGLEPEPPLDTPQLIRTLQVRYSRALCRAALQLTFHSKGATPIEKLALTNLLNAISLLGKIEELDSPDHLITHYYPGPLKFPTAPVIYATISGDMGIRVLKPDDIGDEDGLLAALTNILGGSTLKAIRTVEMAAIKATRSIVPKLIKQWVKLRNGSDTQTTQYTSEFAKDEDRWGSHDLGTDLQFDQLATTVTNYLVEITHFAIMFLHDPGICALPDIAMKSLYTGVSTRISAVAVDGAYGSIVNISSLRRLKQWLESARTSSNKAWSLGAKTYLLRLLAIRNGEGETVLCNLLSNEELIADAPTILLWILETIADTSDCVDDTEKLLTTVITSIGKTPDRNDLLACFSDDPQGFNYLRKIGSRPKYSSLAAETSAGLIICMNNKQKGKEIKPETALGFLNVVSLTCKSYPTRRDDRFEEFIAVVAPIFESLIANTLTTQESGTPSSSILQVLDQLTLESDKIFDQRSKKSFKSSRTMVEKIADDLRTLKAKQKTTEPPANIELSNGGEDMARQTGGGNDNTQNLAAALRGQGAS